MPQRVIWAHRSRIEWSIRGALAVAATLCGYVSVSHTLGYVMRNQDPVLAHSLSPGDGRVTAQYAQSLARNPDATPAARRRADVLALRALIQDPTTVVAASELALDRQIRGDTLGARRLFSYAQRLSRRELQVQIWAIEDAVARGDVADALTHYDIALRTSFKAHDLLFPILGTAIADPVVRGELIKTLAKSPAWSEAFVNYVAVRGNPRATAQLFSMLRSRSIALPDNASSALVDGLIFAGLNEEAWQYYVSTGRGEDRRRSRDPHFSASLETPSAFDWILVNDENVTSSIQYADGGGILEFSAPPSVGGPLLRQFQLLTPGTYILTGRSGGVDQPVSSRPYWTLTCRADGRELGRVEMPNSTHAGGAFRGTFSVPKDCQAQMLTLVARPSITLAGLTGRIEQVQLKPEGR